MTPLPTPNRKYYTRLVGAQRAAPPMRRSGRKETLLLSTLAILCSVVLLLCLALNTPSAMAQQPTPMPVATETVTPTPSPTPVDMLAVAESPSPTGFVALIQQYGWLALVGILILGAALYFFRGYLEGYYETFKKLGEKHSSKPLEIQKTKVQQQKSRKALDTGTASYLRWLQDELQYLPIIPIKSADRPEHLLLQEVYVPLRVVESNQIESFHRLAMGKFDEAGEYRLHQEAFEALKECQRVYRILSDADLLPTAKKKSVQEQTATALLLIGDAGSGKTTTLHFGTLVLAHDYQETTTNGAQESLELYCEQPLLPFYIRLTLVATYIREAHQRADGKEIPKLQGASSQLLLDWLDSYTHMQVHTETRTISEHMPSQRIKRGGCLVLLDGLDETGDEEDRRYMQRLIGNLKQDYPNNRYIVASRPFEDLRLPGFARRHLSPMNEEEMQTLLRNWFGAMYASGSVTRQQQARADDQFAYLWNLLQQKSRLFVMATNPLLLTSMALMVYTGMGLPRERAKLYFNLIDLLLEQWRLQQITEGLPGRRSEQPSIFSDVESQASIQRRLQTLAAWMQEQERREIRLYEAQEQLRTIYTSSREWHTEEADDYVCRLLESLSLESGLIQQRDGGYSFSHYTLQEYLTAREYDLREQGVDALFAHHQERRWHETILLAVGHWATSGKPEYAQKLLRQLLNTQDTDALLLAASALYDADSDRVLELSALRTETIQRLKSIAFFPATCPALTTRNDAAELLDCLNGDTRTALDFTTPDYWAQRIEPGEFVLGDDNGKYDDETPAIPYRILHPYALARFPVTNRQYLAFLEDLEKREGEAAVKEHVPDHWLSKRYRPGEGNHPVVNIDWFSASKFAAWLDEYLKEQGIIAKSDLIRLPTEPEWERAAAFPVSLPSHLSKDKLVAIKRTYPWGEWQDNRANSEESGIGSISVVGIFPHGQADCGAEELAGNVWEWCSTPYIDSYKDYPKPEKMQAELLGARKDQEHMNFVLRGGAFWNDKTVVRCPFRYGDYAALNRFDHYGFRLARLFS